MKKLIEKYTITDYKVNNDQSIEFCVNGIEVILLPIYAGYSGMAMNFPAGAKIMIKNGDKLEFICQYHDYINERTKIEWATVYKVERNDELKELSIKIRLPIIVAEIIEISKNVN